MTRIKIGEAADDKADGVETSRRVPAAQKDLRALSKTGKSLPPRKTTSTKGKGQDNGSSVMTKRHAGKEGEASPIVNRRPLGTSVAPDEILMEEQSNTRIQLIQASAEPEPGTSAAPKILKLKLNLSHRSTPKETTSETSEVPVIKKGMKKKLTGNVQQGKQSRSSRRKDGSEKEGVNKSSSLHSQQMEVSRALDLDLAPNTATETNQFGDPTWLNGDKALDILIQLTKTHRQQVQNFEMDHYIRATIIGFAKIPLSRWKMHVEATRYEDLSQEVIEAYFMIRGGRQIVEMEMELDKPGNRKSAKTVVSDETQRKFIGFLKGKINGGLTRVLVCKLYACKFANFDQREFISAFGDEMYNTVTYLCRQKEALRSFLTEATIHFPEELRNFYPGSGIVRSEKAVAEEMSYSSNEEDDLPKKDRLRETFVIQNDIGKTKQKKKQLEETIAFLSSSLEENKSKLEKVNFDLKHLHQELDDSLAREESLKTLEKVYGKDHTSAALEKITKLLHDHATNSIGDAELLAEIKSLPKSKSYQTAAAEGELATPEKTLGNRDVARKSLKKRKITVTKGQEQTAANRSKKAKESGHNDDSCELTNDNHLVQNNVEIMSDDGDNRNQYESNLYGVNEDDSDDDDSHEDDSDDDDGAHDNRDVQDNYDEEEEQQHNDQSEYEESGDSDPEDLEG